MSQIITQATTPLWKDGRNGNVQFLASWKRLQKEDPKLYGLIGQKDGFKCETAEYEYRVGKNSYGLYLMRRKLDGLESIPQQLEKDLVPQRPPAFTSSAPVSDPILIQMMGHYIDAMKAHTEAIKLQTLAMLASTNEQKEEIGKAVMKQ
jgi:hypothetical protein